MSDVGPINATDRTIRLLGDHYRVLLYQHLTTSKRRWLLRARRRRDFLHAFDTLNAAVRSRTESRRT